MQQGLGPDGAQYEHPSFPDLHELLAPNRSGLLIVDVQHHFLDERVAVGVPTFLDNLERLIAAARSEAVPCIFIRAVAAPDTDTPVWVSRHASKPHRLGNREGTPASEFHPRIRPRAGETVITKSRYSSFLGTGLEATLRERGIDAVIVTGVQSDVCVQMTAIDAFQRDFWTATVSDCTTTRSEEDQEHAMRLTAMNWGLVVSADDVIRAWIRARSGESIASSAADQATAESTSSTVSP